MPSKYRDELVERSEGQLVITIDLADPCLCIYPLTEWEKIEAQLSKMPSLRPETRRFNRLLIGSAVDLELDSSGRILIPTRLRERAKLDKQVILVGQLHKFQLWDENVWNELLESDLAAIQEPDYLPEDLMNLVL